MERLKRPFIIFFLGLALRLSYLYFYKDLMLNWDELFPISMNLSSPGYSELLRYLALEDCHPPLFVMIARSFVIYFKDPLFSVRIMNLLFSTLNVILIYCLLRKYSVNKRISLNAMLLMAVSPWMLKESVNVLMYTVFLTFCMLSCITFADLLKKRTLENFVFFLISNLLLVYTHYFSIFVIIPQMILSLKDRSTRKIFMLNYTLLFLFFLPFLLVSNSSPLNPAFYQKTLKGSIGWVMPVDFSSFLPELLKSYFIFDLNFPEIVSSLFLIFVFIYALKKSPTEIRFIFFLPPLFLLLVSFFYQNFFDQGLIAIKHFAFIIPLLFYSLAVFFSDRKRRNIFFVLIFVFLLVSSIHLLRENKGNGDFLEYFAKKILPYYMDEKTSITIFPKYYFINVQYYMKDFSSKVNVLSNRSGLKDIKKILSDDYYNKHIFFIRCMEGESLHSWSGKFRKIYDYLRSQKDTLFKRGAGGVNLFFHPYKAFKDIRIKNKRAGVKSYMIRSLSMASKILLYFIMFFSIGTCFIPPGS